MPQVTVYIREDDLDKWKALDKKSEFLSNALNETGSLTGLAQKGSPELEDIKETIAKIPNEYKEQIWSYFLVNPDLKWVDFVSYDPRLAKKPIWILRINREDVADELNTAKVELIKFIIKLEQYRSEIFF